MNLNYLLNPKALVALGLCSVALAAHASWPQIFDDGGTTASTSAAIDGAGNVFVAGSSNTTGNPQVLLIKYDKAGVLKWSKTLNLTNVSRDYAVQVAIDSAGNAIVGGTSVVNRDPSKFFAMKIGSNGGLIWKKGYTTSGLYDHWVRSIAVDSSDNVLLTGGSNYGNTGFTTIKADANGLKLWSKSFSGSGMPDEQAVRIDSDPAGDVYVFGNLYRQQGWYTAIVKYSSTGAQLWVKQHYGLTNTDPYSHLAGDMAIDSAGGVAVTEATYDSNDFGFAVEVNRYNSQANLLWSKPSGAGPKEIVEFPGEVLIDANNNVYATLKIFNELFAAKYDATGATIWADFYLSNQPADYLNIVGIGLDDDSNFYVGGTCRGVGDTHDFLTIKYDAMGQRKFVKKYDSPTGSDDIATAAVVDSKRSKIYTTGASGPSRILTIRN